MKRVLVIGPGGSGKSTFSRTLGEKLRLPVLHLDRFYWKSGWIKPTPEQWLNIVDQLLAQESWIIDGNFSGTLPKRIVACDTIVFLDLPTLICLMRILKRRLFYRNRSRPDMADGCKEKLDLEFLQWVLSYSHRNRPRVVELLKQNSTSKKVVWLRSRNEVSRFLDSL